MFIRHRYFIGLFAAFLSLLSYSSLAQKELDDKAPLSVDVWGIHILEIRAQYHERTPDERVANITKKILDIPLADTYTIEVER